VATYDPLSGGVPLLEAAKCGSDMIKQGVVETFIQESPIAEMLPWMTIAGNALKSFEEGSLPDLQFRSVNEQYNRVWGSDVEHFWGVTILGAEVFIDNYLTRVTANQQDLKAKQYGKVTRSLARKLDVTSVRGTGDSKDFKGFNQLIEEGFGQRISSISSGTTPLDINASAANGQAFLDKLDEANDLLRNQSTADFILLNRATRRAITRAARTSVSGVSLIDVGTDVFGRQVVSWNDTPLKIVGDDHTGAAILSQTETAVSNANAIAYTGGTASSLYMVSTGDMGVQGLLGAGGTFEVRDFGEIDGAPGSVGRIELYPGLAAFSKYGLVRLHSFDA
jgi:hypothetical protein